MTESSKRLRFHHKKVVYRSGKLEYNGFLSRAVFEQFLYNLN